MVDVEVDGDGLVRTVSVEYSLLAKLAWDDRASTNGVTKKRLRLPVQRLVLIPPVEKSGQVLHRGKCSTTNTWVQAKSQLQWPEP